MKINVVIIVPKAEELTEISSRKIAIKQKEQKYHDNDKILSVS